MEKYFKRKRSEEIGIVSGEGGSSSASASTGDSMASWKAFVDSNRLFSDPAQGKLICQHHPNQVDECHIRFCVAISCCRRLLIQGLPFRADDDTEDSLYRGNFLDLIKLILNINRCDFGRNADLRDAPEASQMVPSGIEEDIVHCFAQEIMQHIIEEFKDDYFSLMVDQCCDVFGEEQLALFLRFVDSSGNVKERFIGVVRVMEITALSFKITIDNVLTDLGLSLKKLRGLSYNGTSYMMDKFRELKTLIMNENQSAYYVHCFAQQLQLVLVGVATQHHLDITRFFNWISMLINVVGATCERKDMLPLKQVEKVVEGIKSGLIEIGKGLNEEINLETVVDACWGFHHRSLLNLVPLFSSTLEVLEVVSCDARDTGDKVQADRVLEYVESFDFVFYLQLMLIILGITNPLSLALQRKDEDILNAMTLVKVTRSQLQTVRDDGWGSLLGKITAFCNENKIDCLDMNDEWVNPWKFRPKRNITNEFHYRFECFYPILDRQLLEINDRFNEVNSELLRCVASLNPSNGFCDFNTTALLRLTQFYPDDFSVIECMALENQLETYIIDVRADDRFSQLKGLGDLSTLLVQTKKCMSYPLVYRLLKLALILPVATSSVERCFSAMNIVKTNVPNETCEQFSKDCLICYVENDLLRKITHDDVIKRFQSMKTPRG